MTRAGKVNEEKRNECTILRVTYTVEAIRDRRRCIEREGKMLERTAAEG